MCAAATPKHPPKPQKVIKPGKFTVSILEARNLPSKKDAFPNVYCLIGPIDVDEEFITDKLIKTKTIHSGHPTWNEKLEFEVVTKCRGFKLECWDEQKKPKFLGCVIFPPQILLDGREFATWFSFGCLSADALKKKKVTFKGDIYLSLYYLSDELRQELNIETPPTSATSTPATTHATTHATTTVTPTSSPSVASTTHTNTGNTAFKSLEKIDSILDQIKSGSFEGAKALESYVISINSSTGIISLDNDYAKNAKTKKAIEIVKNALTEIASTNSSFGFRAYCSSFLGLISEYDDICFNEIISSGLVNQCLETFEFLSIDKPEESCKCFGILALGKNIEVKKNFLQPNIVKNIANFIKASSTLAEVQECCFKFLNHLYIDAENGTPSSKEITQVFCENQIFSETFIICRNFVSNESVVENVVPFIDHCCENVKPSDIGNGGIEIMLEIIQKHRFPIQVGCLSILNKAVEEEGLAKHAVTCNVIVAAAKIFNTESFLRAYEIRSREISLKFFNRLANDETNFTQIRENGIIKGLASAMSTHFDRFIIQIQAIMLIKTLAKDSECRQLLQECNVSQLLGSAKKNHTVTRLQRLVAELQETYNW
eukprot:TRINITY_DN1630_c0_g1_i2.p1 TRINITY_DN1630_c0_g1~~TRINITY_DN1630_c0_g1_i2.p1  ORF type:complete len:615 (-),score=259.46 TRINITY_DN1630_c0_g1_i2:90-1892(-)